MTETQRCPQCHSPQPGTVYAPCSLQNHTRDPWHDSGPALRTEAGRAEFEKWWSTKVWACEPSDIEKMYLPDMVAWREFVKEACWQTWTARAARERELREALEEIAEPVPFMRKRAEAEGSKLNGQMAVALSDDSQFLKSIARAALAEPPSEKA